MPEMKTKVVSRSQQRIDAMRERLGTGTVKVLAANETFRRVLRHPSGNLRFQSKIDQAVEWPKDSYTRRRIAEGAVYVEGTAAPPKGSNDPKLNPRERAASRRPQATKKEEAPAPSKKSEASSARTAPSGS